MIANALQRLVYVLTAIVFVTGCSVTRPAPEKQAFLIAAKRPAGASTAPMAATTGVPSAGAGSASPATVSNAPPASEAARSTSGAMTSLSLNAFGVAAPFRSRAIVYREDEERYQSDFYNEYFAPPGSMIADATQRWLVQSKLFKIVFPPGTPLSGDLVLDGFVSELYGDFRNAREPAAVIAIQFYVSDPSAASNPVLYAREIRERANLPDRTARSLAKGLGEALAKVLTELEQDLAKVELKARAP